MNLQNKRLLIIGVGNMAEAMIQGLLDSKKLPKENIAFTEVRIDRREYIQKKYGVRPFLENRDGVLESDIILFAVKPQNIQEVLNELKRTDSGPKVYISIAAGVKIQKFEDGLGEGARVIRVMPNMAALIRKGISGVSRGRFAAQGDEDAAVEIMTAVGEVVRLPENLLDAVTALSGSGPAYFFYFIEALQEAGIQLGLSSEISAKLVQSTALGAALLVRETQETPESLRKKVTSPGGTTEAALRFFDENKLKDLIVQAVQRAEKRSKELSQG
jgi:pyrroline-5-carboxylate reductase